MTKCRLDLGQAISSEADAAISSRDQSRLVLEPHGSNANFEKSPKLNVMKPKSGWIQVSKRFDICQTRVEMSTLSPAVAVSAV